MDYTYEQWNEYPLRILVPSDAVGAIIGKQGSIVKHIKQTTNTKIDVNKSTSAIGQERVIVIRGPVSNCIQACREILEIIYTDSKAKNKSTDLILKVLAHNNFVGRIIGKGGNIINTIKKDTETNVTVSSINDLNANNFERVISIKGELEQQIRALEMIYTKLYAAFEHDQAQNWGSASSTMFPYYQPQQQQQLMHYFTQQAASMPNVGASLMSTPYVPPQPRNTNSSSNTTANYELPYQPPLVPIPSPFYMPYLTPSSMMPPFYDPSHSNAHFSSQQHFAQSSENNPIPIETVRLYVPNTMIGSIIGTKGLFIKSIIKNSNASVKVTPPTSEDDATKNSDREILISGTPEAQWKSQYYIFDKLRQEGYYGHDEVRLRAEINVPTSLIGRLIGKGGQNVRQLQQSTGATIKLPDDSQQTSANEISVQIIGTFQASQFAQRRIQSIIQLSRNSSNGFNDETAANQDPPISSELPGDAVNNEINEVTSMMNGHVINDDAVVASSTSLPTDHSVTTITNEQDN